MLSANEAKKKTQDNINNCITQEFKKIEEQINDAIFEGEYSISNNGRLKHIIKEKLKELGYKIEISSQYNEPYYIISWK